MRVVYRTGPTPRSVLTKVKDPLPMSQLENVVYDSEILCECGIKGGVSNENKKIQISRNKRCSWIEQL